jgi:hypothetical protein
VLGIWLALSFAHVPLSSFVAMSYPIFTKVTITRCMRLACSRLKAICSDSDGPKILRVGIRNVKGYNFFLTIKA